MEKKEKRKKSRLVTVLLILAGLLLAAVVLAFSLRVENLTVEGNDYYSEAEIEDMVFSGSFSRSPLVIWLNQLLGREKEIPFVEKYRIRLTGLTSAEVTVYEKSLVGYVEFMGSCLYFDKDGMVVESSQEHYGSVPQVTGLDVDYVVLSEKLPVENETIFQELLQMSQFFSTTKLEWNGEEILLIEQIDRIHFNSSDDVFCYIGEIEVSLGSSQAMEGKLQEMTDILPKLFGRRGTLHLETYDETLKNPSYIFKNKD